MVEGEPVRAAVFRGPGSPMMVEPVTLGPPGPTEVRVRMAAVGLCHTELHVLRGEIPLGMTPMVLGHEGSGIVDAVGSDVCGVVEGDHVALTWLPACGKCAACRKGNHHRCAESTRMVAGTQLDGTFRRRDSSGHDVGGFCFVGAFAEATVVDQASVVTVDRDIPLEVVALAACGVTGGFGAVLHAVRVRPGDAVLIVGAGGTGISAVQAARASGASQIIVADTQEWKLGQAKDFGATDTILVGEPYHLADEVLQLTARGVEFAFVCIGVAEVLEQAIRATAVGGTVVITALIMSTDAASALDPLALQLGQKTVIGSQYGSLSQRYGIPETLRHYQNGSLRIAEMISRTYRLDEISSGFEDLAAGRNVRGLVRFN